MRLLKKRAPGKILSKLTSFLISYKINFKIARTIDNKNIFSYSQNYISFNSACIKAGGYFYKVALNKGSNIREEYVNYQMLKKYLINENILPQLIFKGSNNVYIKMDILHPIERTEFPSALNHIYASLSKFASLRETHIDEQENIKVALNFLKTLEHPEKITAIEKWVKIVFEKQFLIGLCHGDLHLRNIMKNDAGSYQIIDFDCVKKTGLLDLDVFNFMIEMENLDSSADWREQLIKFHDHLYESEKYKFYTGFIKMKKSEVVMLYFLERIGLNFKFYDASFDEALSRNIRVLDFFMEKINSEIN